MMVTSTQAVSLKAAAAQEYYNEASEFDSPVNHLMQLDDGEIMLLGEEQSEDAVWGQVEADIEADDLSKTLKL